ncbi:MAG: hypothetical protein ACREJ3_03005 [Polyangiaceae bacterium]
MRPAQSKLDWVTRATVFASVAVVLWMIGFTLWPTLTNTNTIGGHDWDQMESYRYLVQKTVLRFHQFPFWDPYSCGGYTSWGGFESGTTIVSPWLPFYLTMSLPHAMRVEVFGMALLSAAGAWLFAGRFTRSPALRAFVAVAFAVNGRWALQTTAGHTWHLAYAWTPWVFYFFDRAAAGERGFGPPRRRDVVLMGACVAMMAYMGGIYPLPQTAVAVAVYAFCLAAVVRSFRPIIVGVIGGAISFGLAAPKLLPILEVLRRYPRLVDSPESLDFPQFIQILTAPHQDMNAGPIQMPWWGWHEWGMYVGWPVVIAVTIGCLAGRGPRASPLKWAGFAVMALGFGTFAPDAPWPLLRELPIFKSQHVPSRWLYPGLLLLLVVTAATFERILRRAGAWRAGLEIAAVAGVAWIAHDIAMVSRQPLSHAFQNQMPPIADSLGPFRMEIHIPPELNFSPDWAPHSLPTEMANIGTIDCGTFPGLHNYYRDAKGRAPGLGARGRGDPLYRGETYIAEGMGKATLASFTPNVMTVRVTGAKAGEHVVLNQNWDSGWKADGKPVLDWVDQDAAELHGPEATIVFRYRPRLLPLGLALFALTAGGIGFAYYRSRKRPIRPS